MLYLELHEDSPGESALLEAGLDQIKLALKGYGLLDISTCQFRIVRNGPEYVQNGKSTPFIRIAVSHGEDVFIIANLIRARKPHTRIATYGIDVITMPVYIPAGKKAGRWYDPTDPLRAVLQAKKGETK